MSAESKADWAAAVRNVHTEAGGLLEVSIVDARTGTELLMQAALGDNDALALMRAVTQTVARVRQAPPDKPALCICCPRAVKRVSPATIFGVATPAVANPTGAIGFVFCDRCAADRATLMAKAGDGLRRIWPDAREVAVTHSSGGRA